MAISTRVSTASGRSANRATISARVLKRCSGDRRRRVLGESGPRRCRAARRAPRKSRREIGSLVATSGTPMRSPSDKRRLHHASRRGLALEFDVKPPAECGEPESRDSGDVALSAAKPGRPVRGPPENAIRPSAHRELRRVRGRASPAPRKATTGKTHQLLYPASAFASRPASTIELARHRGEAPRRRLANATVTGRRDRLHALGAALRKIRGRRTGYSCR